MFNFIYALTADASASGTTAGTEVDALSSILTLVIPLAIIVIVFYFFILRPQKKQDKETAEMRDSINLGDIIITAGGIVGRVIRIKDDMLLIETGGNKTRLQIERRSVREIKAKANQPEKQD